MCEGLWEVGVGSWERNITFINSVYSHSLSPILNQALCSALGVKRPGDKVTQAWDLGPASGAGGQAPKS